MKVVVYHGQKKYTVANIAIPNLQKFNELFNEEGNTEMTLNDLQLCNFSITSTRGAFSDDEVENEELVREIEEGINWRQETVN